MYAELIREITNTEVLINSMKGIAENFSANNAIMIVMMLIKFVEINMDMEKSLRKPLGH